MIEILKDNQGRLDKVNAERCSISAVRLGQEHWTVVITDAAMNSLSLEINGYLTVTPRPIRDAEQNVHETGGRDAVTGKKSVRIDWQR